MNWQASDAQAQGDAVTPWGSPHIAERRSHGLWPQPLSRRNGADVERFHAYLGSGVGGSSLLYAAALERLERFDFEGGTLDSHTLPAWPVGFDEFAPFYDEAERLYRVGSANARSAADQRMG